MDLERVVEQKAADLVAALTELGFSREEAERFLVEVGPALARSYSWQAETLDTGGLGDGSVASELLSGIRGRSLASRLGLSQEKTWAGLREVVPTVVEASRKGSPGRSNVSGCRRGAGRGDPPWSGATVDVGFGLTLGAPRRAPGNGRAERSAAAPGTIRIDHPIFGRLLSKE